MAEVLHGNIALVNVKRLTTLHGNISWQHVQVAFQLEESWALLKSLVVAAEPLLHLQVHHHVLSCIFQHTYHRSVASGGMLTGAPVSCLILSVTHQAAASLLLFMLQRCRRPSAQTIEST